MTVAAFGLDLATSERPPSGRELRVLRKLLQVENAHWPARMREVPMENWPAALQRQAVSLTARSVPVRAWRSKYFVAHLWDEGAAKPRRLTVHRPAFGDDGRFAGGITWDELMQVKRECGFGERDALELFPADRDVVDVNNLRHLWILTERSPLTWTDVPPAGHR